MDKFIFIGRKSPFMLHQSKYLLLTLIFFIFQSDSLHAQQKNNTGPAVFDKIFDNGIKIKQNGFSVRKAYLVFDNGTRIPPDNKVGLNQVVNLAIVIDKGWTVENGKAFPGGSEDIQLSTGYQVLKADDLFSDYSVTGIDPADARFVTIKASIKSITNKKSYVVVKFRIWDKKSTHELTGIYNFSIK